MHWRGGCIAREGAHATPCCSVLALVRVRSAGCPARESVAACRGRSCRCGPAADRTPALQDGSTSLHKASESGRLAVVQTLLEHGADIAARSKVCACACTACRVREDRRLSSMYIYTNFTQLQVTTSVVEGVLLRVRPQVTMCC